MHSTLFHTRVVLICLNSQGDKSAIGGLVGIVLGWIITFTLSEVAGWATAITPASVLISFFFSAMIGVVFGVYPARKAAVLNPIDALRHE